eukprot:CAMPEP_0170286218 /NCGR_PEP_ID=MMETSP0116_2-20130129/43163_1 /TAXON_ID=400756 /ORGANISM="Durinskia baltica, Strain CSIRO CS-38" /LENGTH=169 /DNA_ID=CAMNT_0010537629 /DNA_START=77 /DNA_END=584 /DNA_ORIENTATION=+
MPRGTHRWPGGIACTEPLGSLACKCLCLVGRRVGLGRTRPLNQRPAALLHRHPCWPSDLRWMDDDEQGSLSLVEGRHRRDGGAHACKRSLCLADRQIGHDLLMWSLRRRTSGPARQALPQLRETLCAAAKGSAMFGAAAGWPAGIGLAGRRPGHSMPSKARAERRDTQR